MARKAVKVVRDKRNMGGIDMYCSKCKVSHHGKSRICPGCGNKMKPER